MDGKNRDSNLLPVKEKIMEKSENKVQGTIIQIMPETSGTGKTGNPWKKQEFLLETSENYPKKILFTVWGEKIDQFALREGEFVSVFIDIESREYNGRWYTDLKAWRVEKAGAPSHNPVSGPSREKTQATSPPPAPADDLPF